MIDKVTVTLKNPKTAVVTRTLTEEMSTNKVKDRIKVLSHDIEKCEDALENLVVNRQKLIKDYMDKLDKDAMEYEKAVTRLKENRKALEDALKTGKGEAQEEVEDTK